jgi:uncharacterized protein (TIGR02001 family)
MKKSNLIVAFALLATISIGYAEDSTPEPLNNAQERAPVDVEDPDDYSYWGWTPSASVTFTSDYVFRGVSQTSNSPAIQGSFGATHETGFYVGAWASNVQFDSDPFSGNSMELDIYGGFSRETDFGGSLPFSFTYDIGWLSYIYPENATNLNYNEVYFGLGVAPVDDLNFSTYYYQDVGITNKFGTGYLDMSADYTLPSWAWGIKVLAHGGRYFKDGSPSQGNAYWDWKAGISKNIAGFDVELAYTDTNGKGGFGDLDDARFVASISRSLGDPRSSPPMPDGLTASASVALTSDYTFRGISQTSNGMAIQGSVDIAHELGFYAGAWGSNVEFDDGSPNSLEIDVYGGFSRETDFGGKLPFSFTYDIGWIAYLYPEATDSLNYNEVYFGLGAAPVDNLNVSTYYYQDVGITNKFATGYLDVSADYTLPSWAWGTTLLVHGGRYFKGGRSKSYWDWKAGLAKDIGPFNIEVAYVDTSGADAGDLDDARGVATISTNF